jgi:hypothetical protein
MPGQLNRTRTTQLTRAASTRSDHRQSPTRPARARPTGRAQQTGPARAARELAYQVRHVRAARSGALDPREHIFSKKCNCGQLARIGQSVGQRSILGLDEQEFSLVSRGGQGRGRTAVLPIFRSLDNSSPSNAHVRDLHRRIDLNINERRRTVTSQVLVS